ncbi:hypothetical protein S4A8_03528 [Salinisphaera sp. S4-8]|uniref:helix-turn-helix transcriptional regulator n=1 Tax=Salinisphaera sp. S4-8 TaxID=633357 RepID=UPI003342437C
MKKSIALDPGRIRYWRERRGYTQQALGDAVLDSGKPASRLRGIQAWERSGKVWDRLVDDLARALEVDITDLERSDADIAGLWLCWRCRSLPPQGAQLQPSLHAAFDHIRAQIERGGELHDGLQATLVDADTLFRIELRTHEPDRAPRIEPLFIRPVRWSTRQGLLWRRPTTLERRALQRLFDQTINAQPGVEPRAVNALQDY